MNEMSNPITYKIKYMSKTPTKSAKNTIRTQCFFCGRSFLQETNLRNHFCFIGRRTGDKLTKMRR